MEGILRKEFRILDKKLYFNTCSIGPLANSVKQDINKLYLDNWDSKGGISWLIDDGWTEIVEKARESFAKLIGAKSEEIAYSFGNSVAFTSIYSALMGDGEILFNDLDFPAFPSHIMASSRNNKYKIVKSNGNLVSAEDYKSYINERTKLVTACEVASNTGSRIDINSLVDISHDKGVPVFVDSYQSIGVIPTDVKKLDIDFLASGCLKWLLGGFGISFLYVRHDLIEDLNPSSIGWMGVDNPFEDLYDKLRANLFRPADARKFQFGTPYPIGAISAYSGMELILKIGMNKIFNHNEKLGRYLVEKANEHNLKLLTPLESEKRGSIFNLQIPQAENIVNKLQKENVIIDMRSRGVRVALHFFNSKLDVDLLFDKINAKMN